MSVSAECFHRFTSLPVELQLPILTLSGELPDGVSKSITQLEEAIYSHLLERLLPQLAMHCFSSSWEKELYDIPEKVSKKNRCRLIVGKLFAELKKNNTENLFIEEKKAFDARALCSYKFYKQLINYVNLPILSQFCNALSGETFFTSHSPGEKSALATFSLKVKSERRTSAGASVRRRGRSLSASSQGESTPGGAQQPADTVTTEETNKAKQSRFLRKWIKSLGKIEHVNLINRCLTDIPAEIAHLKGVKTINLSRNKITSLPPSIAKLNDLEKLSLNDNSLTSLPKELALLPKLSKLDLLLNPHLILPPELSRFLLTNNN